jgi:cyclophilin family peptidyl-prolyl cis-trans isomerase
MKMLLNGLVLALLLAARDGIAGTLAQFRMPEGEIDVELLDQDKPVTVRNFINLVKAGAYQNTFFHRCITNFIIQGGGFYTTNRNDSSTLLYVGNVPSFGPITNEYSVGRKYSNVFGTLAMAKIAGDPNSATSQWFFNLADNSTNSANLDNQNGGFTVFARVTEGTNILAGFNQLLLSQGIVDLRFWYGDAGAAFSDLPVLYTGLTPPKYTDLVYVDITLLQVQVAANIDGSQVISWNSVSNHLNQIEYTTAFPPSWQPLKAVNGDGTRLSVTDFNAANDPKRFYRVRVDY